jgi:predicted nucleic acid-binding protein
MLKRLAPIRSENNTLRRTPVMFKLAFSLWNIGEVLGALDKARYLNRMSEEDYTRAKGFQKQGGLLGLGWR